MNMTVTYHFSSLAALADYLDNKARDLRASSVASTNQRKREKQIEASTLENIAYTLRNTVIEP